MYSVLMAHLIWLLALLHGSNSYILLTANLDDIEALAKQISNSPVADQINTIWRRASTIFNQQLRTNNQHEDENQPRFQRSNPDLDSFVEQSQDIFIKRRHQSRPHRTHRSGRRSHTDIKLNNTETGQTTELEGKTQQEREVEEHYNKIQVADESVQDVKKQENNEESGPTKYHSVKKEEALETDNKKTEVTAKQKQDHQGTAKKTTVAGKQEIFQEKFGKEKVESLENDKDIKVPVATHDHHGNDQPGGFYRK